MVFSFIAKDSAVTLAGFGGILGNRGAVWEPPELRIDPLGRSAGKED